MLKETLIFGCLILAIDLPWLKLYMTPKYEKLLGKMGQKISFNPTSAIIAYMIMIFSYSRLIKSDTLCKTRIRAIIVGLVIYGTYGFTLAAFLPHYDLAFATQETVWGMFLMSVCATITYQMTKRT